MSHPFGTARVVSTKLLESDQGRSRLKRLLGGRSKKVRGYAPSFGTRHLPGLKLEALEPRYLLSADLLPFRIDMAGDDGAEYSLRYDNLFQAINVYDDRTGVLLDHRLAQDIEYIRVVGTSVRSS